MDDAWEDGEAPGGDGDGGAMALEWRNRQRHFHTLGYRDGLSAGKEKSVQKGFNAGFSESVATGFEWGVARGVTSGFAVLAPEQQELLIRDVKTREDLKSLHTAAMSVSTQAAMTTYCMQESRNKRSDDDDVDARTLASRVKAIADQTGSGLVHERLHQLDEKTTSTPDGETRDACNQPLAAK